MFPPACYAPVRCRKLGAEVRSSRTLQLRVVPIGGSVPPLKRQTSSICERALNSRFAFLLLLLLDTRYDWNMVFVGLIISTHNITNGT